MSCARALALLAVLSLACPREARPEESPAPPARDCCRSDRDCGANAICDKSNEDDDDVVALTGVGPL